MVYKNSQAKCNDPRCLFDRENEILQPRFIKVTDVTREGRGLWESCAHCNLVINRVGVAPNEVINFYNSEYQNKNSFNFGETINARQHFEIRINSIKPRANFLYPFISKESIVFELGAGTGELLALMKEKVRECHANELCQEFVDFMNKELKIIATSGDYLDFSPEEKWDLAISIGTLDHIYYTRKYIEKLFSDIKSGGLLYIEVPNDNQALKTLLPGNNSDKFKEFMYQKAHYYSFTFKTLRKLLEEVGFSVENEFSRHDYSLLNFLNWYLVGKPQQSISEAKSRSRIFSGSTEFESEINKIMDDADKSFREIITKYKFGESICMLARKL